MVHTLHVMLKPFKKQAVPVAAEEMQQAVQDLSHTSLLCSVSMSTSFFLVTCPWRNENLLQVLREMIRAHGSMAGLDKRFGLKAQCTSSDFES